VVSHIGARTRDDLAHPPASFGDSPLTHDGAQSFVTSTHRVPSRSIADRTPTIPPSQSVDGFADVTRQPLGSRPFAETLTTKGTILLSGPSPLQLAEAISHPSTLGRPQRLAFLLSPTCPACRVIRGPSERPDLISGRIDGSHPDDPHTTSAHVRPMGPRLAELPLRADNKLGPTQRRSRWGIDDYGALRTGPLLAQMARLIDGTRFPAYLSTLCKLLMIQHWRSPA
jgi:hypothetical protein